MGLLLCACCLGYFYLLDRVLFTSTKFAPIFQLLLSVYDVQTAWLAVGVCLCASLWNRPAPMVRLADLLARHPHAVALASVAAFGAGAIFVYHDYPFSMDEYAAVFQAKIFASGQLFARLPPSVLNWLVVPGFNGSFLVASHLSGHAIEGYWPGFALLLAPFEFLGIPWLCNAVLAGLAVYLIFRITLTISGEARAAGWAMLFTLASGAFVANAIAYYSMQAHLTVNLLYVWLLLRPTNARALAAGIVGSLGLVLHNPFPHALFALPWIVALALDRDQRRYLVPLILGYLPLGLVVGVGWLILRHDIQSGVHGAATVDAIVHGVFVWPDATVLDMRAASLAKLWIWAVPCLLLFALLGRIRHAGNRSVRLLMQSAVLTFAAYCFVKLDQGHGWGYRYFHSAWGALPVLAGCAMTGQDEAHGRLSAFAGAAAVLSALLIVPLQLSQIDGIISRHLAQVPPPRRPGNNIYFLDPRGGFYLSDMIQIDPLLRAPDLLLASRGAKLDAALLRENWPHAVLVDRNLWLQQWYLGPNDQRRTTPGPTHVPHFVLAFTPHAETPAAAPP